MTYHKTAVGTSPTRPECKHENGWFDTIRGWFFDKSVFCCSDCWKILPLKQYHKRTNKTMKTHIPFLPKIRVSGEEVATELLQQIEKCAKRHNKSPHQFRASFELIPDPRGKEYGHFLLSQVTYDGAKEDLEARD